MIRKIQAEIPLEGGGYTDPALPADIESETDNQDARQIGRALCELAESRPAARDVAHPYCADHPRCHQREGEADAEAGDQSDAEPELVDLKAQHQHGDRSRTRDQSARNPEN